MRKKFKAMMMIRQAKIGFSSVYQIASSQIWRFGIPKISNKIKTLKSAIKNRFNLIFYFTQSNASHCKTQIIFIIFFGFFFLEQLFYNKIL